MEHLEAEKEAEQKIVNKWRNVVKDKDDKPDREKEYRSQAAPVKKVDSEKAVSKATNKWLKSPSKDVGGTASTNGPKPVNPAQSKALSSTGKAGPSGIVKAPRPTTDKSSARGPVKPGLKSSSSSAMKSNSSAALNRSQSVKSAGLKSKSAPAIGRAGSASVKKPYVPHKPAPKAGTSGMGGKMDPKKGGGGGGKSAPKMGGKMGGKFPF